jgi:N-acetylneuraminic acid mutarotase
MYVYRLRGKIGDNYSPYSQIVSAAPSSSANTGDWETIAPFANSAEDSSYRFGPISFSINEKGYVGLGCFPTTVNYCDFKEYDPSTDTWKRKADFPGACRSYAANFVINGEAYVGLGGDIFNPVVLKDFYKYNPSTDTWSAIADFPGNPRLYSLSFSINGKGYVCLGQANDTGFTDVYEYDPLHNTWRKVADAPAPGDRSKPLVIDTKAYVFTNDTTYVFEPGLGETGTWSKRRKCPGGIAEASFVINGISYVFFGDGMHWSFYSYDTANDEWGQKNDFPGYGNSEVASFAIGDFGYIGLGSSNGPAAEFWKFTTVSPKPGSFRSTFDQDAEAIQLQMG